MFRGVRESGFHSRYQSEAEQLEQRSTCLHCSMAVRSFLLTMIDFQAFTPSHCESHQMFSAHRAHREQQSALSVPIHTGAPERILFAHSTYSTAPSAAGSVVSELGAPQQRLRRLHHHLCSLNHVGGTHQAPDFQPVMVCRDTAQCHALLCFSSGVDGKVGPSPRVRYCCLATHHGGH